MVYTDKFDTEAVAKLYTLVQLWVQFIVFRFVTASSFIHSTLNHAEGEFTSVYRSWDTVCHVAVRTNVVEVTMCEYLATNLVLISFEVADVWGDVIDTRVICAREQEAHVDNDDIVLVFNSHTVLTDTHFTKSTNRHDLQLRAVCLLGALLVSQAELLAIIAVINRLIYRSVNDVL